MDCDLLIKKWITDPCHSMDGPQKQLRIQWNSEIVTQDHTFPGCIYMKEASILRGDTNVLKYIVVTATEPCKYSKHQRVVQGRPPKTEFIYKNCVFILTFKLQSPSKYSPVDAIHLWDFFPLRKTSFWTCWFWCLLVVLPFLFHLFHIGKMFPFEDFFHPRKQKKSRLGQDRVNRERGARGSCCFGSKIDQHSVWCG